MRLLVVQEEPGTRWGLPIHVLDVSRELHGRGHRIDLMFREAGDLVPAYEAFCRSVQRGPALRLERRRPATSSAGLALAVHRARGGDYDAVYLQHSMHELFGWLVGAGRDVPSVLHLRYSPPERFGLSALVAMPKTVRFIAVSGYTKQRWVDAGVCADRVDVVHSGVDTALFSPAGPAERREARAAFGLADDETVVLYAGRIHPSKGLHILAEAVSRADLPSVRLVVAGAVDPRPTPAAGDAYLARVRRLAPGNALFAGLVSDMPSLYRLADVVVVPSLVDDALARTVIEGMSCGLPVIGSRTGGIPEALHGDLAALLFEPGDVGALTELIRTTTVAPRLGGRCRTVAETLFSLGREVDGIEACLLRVAERRRSASRLDMLRWGR